MDNILLLFFAVLLIHYIIFLLVIYIGLRRLKVRQHPESPEEFVSVIIPFRNESENILNSLSSIEKLTYPKHNFEVIYVNDHSTDNSAELLRKADKSFNINIIDVPEDYSPGAHKKRAIRFGIENSKGDIIVTTDADCVHQSDWLLIMASCLNNTTGFVAGPVKFIEKNNLFSKLQSLEFAGLVLTGAGLITMNRPVICSAANLAYKKDAYNKVNGFADNLNLSSGDDEFLMQKIHKDTDYKVEFCYNKDSVVLTDSNKKLDQFYQQRKRWASKGMFYHDKLLIFKLIMIYLFYLGIPLQIILGFLYNPVFLVTASVTFLLKSIVEFLIIKPGINFLFSRNLITIFPIAEILHIPYIIVAGISGLFGNFTWKERKVKR